MMGKPLVISSDNKIYLIESLDQNYIVGKNLKKYATLIKMPEGIHTYIIDDYSLWSAASMSITAEEILQFLLKNSKNKVPQKVKAYINSVIKEFYTVNIVYKRDEVTVVAKNKLTMDKVMREIQSKGSKKSENRVIPVKMSNHLTFNINKKDIITLKGRLLSVGVFAIEIVENIEEITFKASGKLYSYQAEAIGLFLNTIKSTLKGRGVITMPPGTGKTLVGLKVIETLKVRTLVLVENDISYKVWKEEIECWSNLSSAAQDKIKINIINSNITIVTYNTAKNKMFSELADIEWGLIIYDDVHKLPAKQTAKTAYFFSQYKLALGSILKRYDQGEYKIFKAIGPSIYSLSIKELEEDGVQIKVNCNFIKTPNINGKNENIDDKKHTALEVYKAIDVNFPNCKIVIASFYLDYLKYLKEKIEQQVLYMNHKTPKEERYEMIDDFNNGSYDKLLASKLLERLPLMGIDIVLAISCHGVSERDEYMRIGKLKSSNMGKRDKVGYYYTFAPIGSDEEKICKKRIRMMSRHGYRFRILKLSNVKKEGEER